MSWGLFVMQMEITPKYLTTEQAAIYCSTSKKTSEKYRYSGIGPNFIKRRGLLRYRPADLDAWMDAGLFLTVDQGRS